MLRLALTTSCALGTGCLLAGCSDDPAAGPAVCGDGELAYGEETCDDGNTTDDDGCSSICIREASLTVHWPITILSGAPRPCPAGFDTVEITKKILSLGEAIHSVPCEAGQATLEFSVQHHPKANSYWIGVAIVKRDPREVLTMSKGASYTAGSVSDLHFPIVADAGRISVGWQVLPSCQARGVAEVRIDAIPASGPVVTKTAPCSDLPGQSRATTELLPAGEYRIAVTAVGGPVAGSGAVDAVAVPDWSRDVNAGVVPIAF